MSGGKSRRKGHGFERLIARRLRKIFPKARRHLEYHATDATGIDLVDTGSFFIQCKRGKRYAPITAIEEIQLDPIEGGTRVLITKADHRETMVVLPFADFYRMLKALHECSRLE